MSFEGKVAFITGASRGIGRAIAIALGKRGATVVGTATSDAGAAKISEYLKAEGIKGAGYMLDVCNPEAIADVYAKVSEKHGVPLILVNNAAVTDDNLFLRMKPEQWSRVIQTNLDGVFHVTKAAMRGMLKARWGRVINITSVVAVMGNPGQANYCAAKAGVIGFTKSIAQEMAVKGITANAVAPGFIDTDMTRELNDVQRQAINEKIPMGKIGQPEDIANTVAFLASDDAAYMTGQTLNVNGGMCMV
ncbi:MAG: 3-oxoacyl-ACP reductase FabG [Coxiellaceae bacterium]|nr:3-oxoacyl-ACP reductase FabG [Coxiellaceae bacterium]